VIAHHEQRRVQRRGRQFQRIDLGRQLADVAEALARIAFRDAFFGKLCVRRIVPGNDLSLDADRARQQFGVIAAGREHVSHAHAGCHAEEQQHLARARDGIALAIGRRSVRAGDRRFDRGPRRDLDDLDLDGSRDRFRFAGRRRADRPHCGQSHRKPCP
jgi:hypothetical protein